MNNNIVRAWKDEFYRQSLSDEERAQLPENPVGELELTDGELESVFAAGGHHAPEQHFSYPLCTHNYECVRPRYSYYRNPCHHVYSYHGDWDDCHTYRENREHR